MGNDGFTEAELNLLRDLVVDGQERMDKLWKAASDIGLAGHTLLVITRERSRLDALREKLNDKLEEFSAIRISGLK